LFRKNIDVYYQKLKEINIMKIRYILTLIVAMASISVCSQKSKTQTMENKDLYIGMSIDEFKQIYPNLKSTKYQKTESFTRKETIYGIDGKWYYEFKNSKLKWFKFDNYISEINQQNFDKCLKATQEITANFIKKYGNPISTSGNQKFRDPFKDHHWGYEVKKTVWKANNVKIKVEFYFMGSKGEYNFIIKIDFHDKNYEY